jgi:hypothetical protein
VQERIISEATISAGGIDASTTIDQDMEEDHEVGEDEDIQQEIVSKMMSCKS